MRILKLSLLATCAGIAVFASVALAQNDSPAVAPDVVNSSASSQALGEYVGESPDSESEKAGGWTECSDQPVCIYVATQHGWRAQAELPGTDQP